MSRFPTQGTTNKGEGAGLAALFCTAVQRALVDIAGSNAAESPSNRSSVGFLDGVYSSYNMAGINRLPIVNGDGTVREVELNYVQRPPTSDFSDSNDNSACNDTKRYEPLVTIERELYPLESPVWQVAESEFHNICMMSISEWRQRIMSSLMDPFMQALDERIITQMAANFGNFYGTGSNAARNVNLINNQGPNVYGFMQLKREYRKINGVGLPIIVGTDAVLDYMGMVKEGCCNDLGLDVSRSNGQAIFLWDENVPRILGAEQFIVMSPGAVQLVVYQRNQGQFEKFGDEFAFTTVEDPGTGIRFDIEVVYDKCARAYNTLLRAQWGLFVLPPDMYAPGSPMDGVNGTLRFRATIT